jgi:purine-binding chemotaxis protein CheW
MQTLNYPQSAKRPGLLDSAGRPEKYLIFCLGHEEFGAEVLKVREIIGLQDITHVPQTPAYVLGVINLRGKVIPVIDLRRKFGMSAAADLTRSCIIVVQTEQGGEPMRMGVVVDDVVEVVILQPRDIEATPDFGSGVAMPYVKGMAKIKERVKILLDLDLVLGLSELSELHGLTELSGVQNLVS